MSTAPGPLTCGPAHRRMERPDLVGLGAIELLARGATLPGNQRLGRLGSHVWQIADLPGEPPADQHQEASEDLVELREADMREAELVEAGLSETGLPWRRREGGWVVPGSRDRPCDIGLSTEDGGLLLECALEVPQAGIEETSQEAVARLLTRAQLGLRFVRAELRNGTAWLAARIEGPAGSEAVSQAVRQAVNGAAGGARLLSGEVASLRLPGVASAFLHFHGNTPTGSAYSS